jgi:uncharacterized protein YebE (UPF0316 family)
MPLEALFASPYGALAIFCLRIVDVSCDTMRVIFTIRGKRAVAASLGFVQALVWIYAVGNAVKHLDSPWHVFGYASGYAMGTFVGITIERAIAYGVATVRVVSKHAGVEIAEQLREAGYGVTEFPGFGRDGGVEIINSVVHRSHLNQVLAIVERWDPEAFVTVEEPKVLRGGLLAERAWRPQWWKSRQRA